MGHQSHMQREEQQATWLSRSPALMTLRGPYIMVHDLALAREFLAPLQCAHLASMEAKYCQAQRDTSSITVQAAPGEGWRSRAAAKKAKRRVPVSAEVDASLLDTESEVASRLAALEVEIRAQVQQQVHDGSAFHSGRPLVSDEQHIRCVAAKHTYKNTVAFADVPTRHWKYLQRSRNQSSPSSTPPVVLDCAGVGENSTHMPSSGDFRQECAASASDGSFNDSAVQDVGGDRGAVGKRETIEEEKIDDRSTSDFSSEQLNDILDILNGTSGPPEAAES